MGDSPTESDRISLVASARRKVVRNKDRSCEKICEICSTILINIVPAIVTIIAILVWVKIMITDEEGFSNGESKLVHVILYDIFVCYIVYF